MQDKTLVCKDCGSNFEFTVREQEFYAEKGFENEPARCLDCRRARKREQNNRGGFGARQPRETFQVTCSGCGADAEVPFKPVADRPVYCKDCYQSQNRSRAAY